MNFILHKDFSEISPESWNTLVEQSIADTPFSRYEYLSEWWKTLGGGEWTAESPNCFGLCDGKRSIDRHRSVVHRGL